MVSRLTLFCPAKLNLYLAVTGRRADGYHNLVSLVTPVALGDELDLEPGPAGFRLACDAPALPVDEGNLVLKAARLFVARTGWAGGVTFTLRKRIPVGAGLGGGSSDAAAALRGLNQLAGGALDSDALRSLAAEVGSDCPLFLAGGPVILRGRGERLGPVDADLAGRLQGQRVLLFKPAFGINTAWAYRHLAERSPPAYLPPEQAEAGLAAWSTAEAGEAWPQPFNSFEAVVGGKFLALTVLLKRLRRRHGLAAALSGSGSACFAFLDQSSDIRALRAEIHAAWGGEAWVAESLIGAGNAC
jgi:4-diphosphocytidyl-2-C-methyl-D-erythritol kinase